MPALKRVNVLLNSRVMGKGKEKLVVGSGVCMGEVCLALQGDAGTLARMDRPSRTGVPPDLKPRTWEFLEVNGVEGGVA